MQVQGMLSAHGCSGYYSCKGSYNSMPQVLMHVLEGRTCIKVMCLQAVVITLTLLRYLAELPYVPPASECCIFGLICAYLD